MIYNTLFILFMYTLFIIWLFLRWSILQAYFWVCKWIYKFRKVTSSILQNFKINTSILEVCFKYTSELKDRYISLESLLQVYFWVSKINTSILKVYFKYTSKIEKKYINLENLLPVYFWVWTIHKYRKSTSSILLSLKIDYLESLLEVYFWVWIY